MRPRRISPLVLMTAASFLGGGLASIGLGQKANETHKVIAAQRFHVVDEQGNPRIVLDMHKGRPAIRLLDAEGRGSVSLLGRGDASVQKREGETSGVYVESVDGNTIIRLGLEYVWPMLKMHYKGDDSLVAVGVVGDGSPIILLREKDAQREGAFRVVFQAPVENPDK
ncbi:MAG: hypothetical protein GY842_22350 [bacterium]|nr:hypothetical protein [bacterium]